MRHTFVNTWEKLNAIYYLLPLGLLTKDKYLPFLIKSMLLLVIWNNNTIPFFGCFSV